MSLAIQKKAKILPYNRAIAGYQFNYKVIKDCYSVKKKYLFITYVFEICQNENSQMWAHGAGSRTMSAVPSSAYYSLQQVQNQQQPSGFRQGQQPSQSYGGAVHNYPDFFQSQTGLSQEHQPQQNLRDGGSQGQSKLQSQHLWQNGY